MKNNLRFQGLGLGLCSSGARTNIPDLFIRNYQNPLAYRQKTPKARSILYLPSGSLSLNFFPLTPEQWFSKSASPASVNATPLSTT